MTKIVVAAGLAVIVAAGVTFLALQEHPVPTPELVRLEGGDFTAGNYQVRFALPDGGTEERWAGTTGFDTLPPYQVRIEPFAIMANEPSNNLFDRFLRDTALPPRLKMDGLAADLDDRPAAMSFDEASSFCIWLGEQIALPMRLPTEAEWEYAARSGTLSPPWATDNGEWEPGRNIETSKGLFDPDKLAAAGSLPPNPVGITGMADGLYEWVSDRASDDDPQSRITKGGSIYSNAPTLTIPTRGVIEPMHPDLVETLPVMARFADRVAAGPVHTAEATARCAVYVAPEDGIGAARTSPLTPDARRISSTAVDIAAWNDDPGIMENGANYRNVLEPLGVVAKLRLPRIHIANPCG